MTQHSKRTTPILFIFYSYKENVNLDPDDTATKKKMQVAYKGLEQLRMYDNHSLNPNSPNWDVTLEQNPMPKPPSSPQEQP